VATFFEGGLLSLRGLLRETHPTEFYQGRGTYQLGLVGEEGQILSYGKPLIKRNTSPFMNLGGGFPLLGERRNFPRAEFLTHKTCTRPSPFLPESHFYKEREGGVFLLFEETVEKQGKPFLEGVSSLERKAF